MRKFVALSAAFAYAGLFNYCLVYAAVTGEGRHPAASSSTEPGGHDSHDHDQEHKDSSHDHAPSQETDTCCTTLTESFPVLAPSAPAVRRPITPASLIAAALYAAFPFISPDLYIPSFAQGPPGPPGRSAFLQPSNPRAPPVLTGV